jgi:hypothetical protein
MRCTRSLPSAQPRACNSAVLAQNKRPRTIAAQALRARHRAWRRDRARLMG